MDGTETGSAAHTMNLRICIRGSYWSLQLPESEGNIFHSFSATKLVTAISRPIRYNKDHEQCSGPCKSSDQSHDLLKFDFFFPIEFQA